ncbi:MAG TPA: glycosyltransferase family 4 protein [Polyangiaceae bacterium]|nr:glycosyltransferase family 4 protein [Polyangiaceae bacterium]
MSPPGRPPETTGVRSVAHLVCSFGALGGAELLPIGVASRAGEYGRTDRLILPAGGPAAASVGQSGGAPVETVRVRDPEAMSTADAWRLALGARARLRGVDVLHVHIPSPSRLGIGLIARGALPTLVTFHLLPARWPRRDFVFFSKRLAGRAARASRRRAPLAFTVPTGHDRDRLAAEVPGVPIYLATYAPPGVGPGAPAAPLPFGEGLRLLTVGRLEPQKGYDDLLEALGAPPVRHLPWSLCMVGDGSQRPGLERRARALGLDGRVRFVGAIPSAGAFPQTDLFLIPSRFEGMPLALLEALHAGLPVLASPLPAHRAVLDGVEGALLDEDRAKWPAQMAALFSDEGRRRAMGRQVLARAQEAYTARAQDTRFHELYCLLAAEAGRRR